MISVAKVSDAILTYCGSKLVTVACQPLSSSVILGETFQHMQISPHMQVQSPITSQIYFCLALRTHRSAKRRGFALRGPAPEYARRKKAGSGLDSEDSPCEAPGRRGKELAGAARNASSLHRTVVDCCVSATGFSRYRCQTSHIQPSLLTSQRRCVFA
jgi:hypothetical protein